MSTKLHKIDTRGLKSLMPCILHSCTVNSTTAQIVGIFPNFASLANCHQQSTMSALNHFSSCKILSLFLLDLFYMQSKGIQGVCLNTQIVVLDNIYSTGTNCKLNCGHYITPYLITIKNLAFGNR